MYNEFMIRGILKKDTPLEVKHIIRILEMGGYITKELRDDYPDLCVEFLHSNFIQPGVFKVSFVGEEITFFIYCSPNGYEEEAKKFVEALKKYTRDYTSFLKGEETLWL